MMYYKISTFVPSNVCYLTEERGYETEVTTYWEDDERLYELSILIPVEPTDKVLDMYDKFDHTKADVVEREKKPLVDEYDDELLAKELLDSLEGDRELDHMHADAFLCGVLRDLGLDKLIEAYHSFSKWYA